MAAKAPPVQSTDSLFLDYVQCLDKDAREHLISQPASAFFLFRMLPDVAQQILLKLIWNSNVTSAIADATSHESALLRQQLQLLYRSGLATKSPQGALINTSFRRAYLKGVMIGSHRCSGIRPVLEGQDKKIKKDIGKNSAERWELVLRYLALPSDQNMSNVSMTTRKLFQAAGLTTASDSLPEITSAGFQFLLLSPVQQLWTYMIEYFKLEAAEGHDIRPSLDLLIRIILCVESRSEAECERRSFYMEETWTARQQELVMHLRELGLIYIRKRKDGYFFLTPLLANLSVPSDDTDSIMERRSGNIVVETNFRVYAYTSSSLQLAILSTFTEMTYRKQVYAMCFKNRPVFRLNRRHSRFYDMSVGVLTRDAVRKALMVGITATQIITFLRANAHPQTIAVSGALHCLPITVADQIRLWEEERRRLIFTDATLYTGFESEREFSGVKHFSQKEGILLYSDPSPNQMLLIVTDEGHDRVKEWWKQNKHNISQA